MSKSLRLPEKWFRRGLWLVSLAFAWFLIGLGSLVVAQLPDAQPTQQIEDFIPAADAQRVQAAIKAARVAEQRANKERDTAQLQYDAERARYQSAREAFDNWVATRHATAQPRQDTELIARTKALDVLKASEDKQRRVLEKHEQASLAASQSLAAAQQHWQALEDAARPQWQAEMRAAELRVFLYRLALTLPLLVVAGWLFAKHRKSNWWPFVWGFIFFALFAFFVELVPYLPEYGGYVRYVVGIVLTVVLGRYAIVALNRYLERQRLQEALPEQERRKELSYDVALERLTKGVCPGCERMVDLKNTEIDFCPHCGIGLFDHCGACHTRKSAFARYCHACGAAAKAAASPATPAAVAGDATERGTPLAPDHSAAPSSLAPPPPTPQS